MPSFDDLLSSARQQLKTNGNNREICGLLVRVLEDCVSSLDTDDALKQEIEGMRVSRRILTKHQLAMPRSPKSRKLVSVQRLLSDVHDFLAEYLYEGKRLTRRSAKEAYKTFYKLIVDVRSAGLMVNLSEIDFDLAWEKDALLRFSTDILVSVIIWIEEDQIDEKIMSFFEAENVFIVPCLMKQVPSRLALLKAAVPKENPPADFRGYFVQSYNPFQGRLRFVISPRDPKSLLQQIQKAGLGSYPILLNPAVMITSGLIPAVEIQTLKVIKSDLMVSSRDIDLRNFCNMSTIIWLNPTVDPETPGAPSKDTIDNVRRHILSGISRHGAVVYEFSSTAGAVEFLNAVSAWLPRLPSLRILVSHHPYRTITGKESVPEYSSPSITSFLLALRTKLSCPHIPVMIFSTDLCTIHDSVYTLPLCKPTQSVEEAVDLGTMWPLTWAPDWSPFDPLLPDQTWAGDLNIFDISCFNLYPKDANGTSDPYIVVSLNGAKKNRLKSRKQDRTLNPDWKGLNWTLHVASTDSLHVTVWDYDTFGKDDFEGEVILPLKEIFKAPMPLYEITLTLKPRKNTKNISGTITLRLGLSIHTKNGESSQSESVEMHDQESIIEDTKSRLIKGRHFGRTLGESLRAAEESGMMHVVHACLLYINDYGLNSIGIFRVVGNRKKVKELQIDADAGREVVLEDPFVAASLLKLYLRELHDPLICRTFYKRLLDLQSLTSYSQLLPAMKELLNQLPQVHRDVLADLLELLKRIAENEKVNLMNAKNLATVIAPSICIPKEVSMGDVNELLLDTNAVIELVEVMIVNNRYIFPEGSDDQPDAALKATLAKLSLSDPSKQLYDRSPPSSPEESDSGEV